MTSSTVPLAAGRHRRTILALGVLALALLAVLAPAARADCGVPANAIEAENCRPGNPASQWDITGDGDASIQGFATDISVDQGETVHFKVDTTASAFRLEIYRMGWYGGDGARRVATIGPVTGHNQGPCDTEGATGRVDCSAWAESASWDVPSDATSGLYFAKLVGASGGAGSSHIVFVVRDDDGASDLLLQTSDTTWEAYNQYGGRSLYTGGPGTNPARAYKVSYDRPFTTRRTSDEDWLFNSEYPMVRFLERNGYDVSYFTGVDTDRRGDELLEHRTFVSVGHDEYWSGAQRANVTAARDAGVNLAFFSGNESFWKTRWEDDHRTLVSYKETHAGAKIDPTSTWTGTWRDPRAVNPEGGRPENALTGTAFMVNSGTVTMQVPAADGRMRFWRDTSIASLPAGTTAALAPETVGYEWDEDLDNGARPAGLIRLSTTVAPDVQRLQDYGSTYARGTATHHLTLYRAPSGALVFGAGTVQWPWGLDSQHDGGHADPDVRMQQATVNLFADMGTQPSSLQAELVRATASTDTTAPTTTIASPAEGAVLRTGRPVTIVGTATDAGGGVVGGVEVSVDGGATWHPAAGRESWSYAWTPSATGTATIRARSTDDSAHLGVASAAIGVTVVARACPCTLFDDAVGGQTANDGQPIEVGVRFRADADGFVTALRFYKFAGWTGTRTGHLWTNDGRQLAAASFSESASGWQEVAFAAPVAVTRDTTYVASYLSSSGDYAAQDGAFTSPFDAAPLHAPASSPAAGNGLYSYGAGGGFPTETFGATNYFADVVFEPADTTAPTVTAVAPAPGSAGVAVGAKVTATFSEALDAATVTGATFALRTGAGASVAATVAYDAATRTATLTPASALAAATMYMATLDGARDPAGNALAAPVSWSFTTAASGSGGAGAPASGPGQPGSGAPASPPAGDRRAPRVRVSPRSVQASRAGVVRLRVACPRGERRCRVQLRLRSGRRYVASATATVTGGRSRVLTLKLTRSARRTLARKRSLKLTALAAARDAAGNRATTRTSIRLRAR